MIVAPVVWPSGLACSVPIRLCLIRLFSGPLCWRSLFFIRFCLLRLFSGLRAGVLSFYPFVLVVHILWPSGLAPSVPVRLRLFRLFSGPLGWRPPFLSFFSVCALSVCACCAFSLALWAGPSVPILWCLRLFTGPLGWRALFLSVCACFAYSLALSAGHLSFYPFVLWHLLSCPLGWRALFLSVCSCFAYSLALWVGEVCSCPFMLVAPVVWPSGLALCVPTRLCLLPPIRLCFLLLFSCPLDWRALFLSVCACFAYSLALWVGEFCSCPFMLVAPVVWPSGLACSVPIRLCLIRLFSGPLCWRALFFYPFLLVAPILCPSCWRALFLSVWACCAYSLAFWAGALCSCPFVLVSPILWPSGLAPSVPVLSVFLLCLCLFTWLALSVPIHVFLLRLFSGPLGWPPLLLSVCALAPILWALWASALCSCPFVLVSPILWPSGLAPCLSIRLRMLRLFSGPLSWRRLFLPLCACCDSSLALSSYPFVLVAPILWPSCLAPSVPIRLCFLRLFSRPLGWLPLFLSVCACCAYSLTLWAGVLCSHPFVLLAPTLWPFVLACSLFIRFCLSRLFSGPLGWRPLFPRPLCGVGSEKIPDVEVAVEKAEDNKLTVVDGKRFAGSGRDVPRFSSARREASLPLSKKSAGERES